MTLRHLFLDLNAYFASCEQQDDPRLRGKPVAVAPIDAPSGCCIAVSYEAKKFGVKTGMRVGEARTLCPRLVVAHSRPRRYVEIHHEVIAAVETCMPVKSIHSIDEMSCTLAPHERAPDAAAALARRIKKAISERVGACMRCSIGIAPNVFLGKTATDMMKPDGLVILQKHELPQKLFTMQLRDLCGIGPKMEQRLLKRGIDTVERLCSLSEKELGDIWGGVVGKRWWYLLRGEELRESEPPARKRSIGHQHVLAPDKRNDKDAWEIAARLMHKAAARARHTGYWAHRMSLSIRYAGEDLTWGGRSSWHTAANFPGGTQDTVSMLESLREMWAGRPPGVPVLVDVTLFELTSNGSTTIPLFTHERQRHEMNRAMDIVNNRYGANTVYLASMHDARTSAPGGIAFKSIPDLTFSDTVRERQRMSQSAPGPEDQPPPK